MATPQSQGGLGAMAPVRPPAPNAQPAQPPNPAQAAQRISGLEQEASVEEDFVLKAARTLREQQQALNSQMDLLRKSAEKRMNPVFDPALMAAAAGFSKPTKTGGFGESLGYALENYAAESEKELARKQANDKTMLERLQQQQKMQNQNLLFENELRRAGYSPEEITTLSTGPAGGAAPAGGSPAEGSAPAGGAKRQRQPITQRDVDIAMMLGDTEKAKQYMEQLKFERDDLMSTPQGTISKTSRKVVDTGLQVPIETSIPFVGVEKVTQKQLAKIEELDTQFPAGHPQRADQFARYYAANGIGGATYTPAVEGRPAVSSMKTSSEREADKLQTSENIKKQTESLQKSRDKIYLDAENARPMLNSANFVYNFATNPKTQGAFGVLSQGDVGGAIGTVISQGLSTPGGGIKVAGIEDAVRLIKGTPDEIRAAQQVASNYAELELAYRNKYFTGTGGGAISDKEQAVVQRIGGGLSDTAQVAAAKAEIVQARARFDQSMGEKFYDWEEKNPNKSLQAFKRSSEYKALVDNFDSHMDKLFNKYYGDTAPAQNKPAGNAPPASSATPAASRPQTKPPANAPAAPPVVTGDDDPAYKNLKPGQQYIYNGQVKTDRKSVV
jgi:hypothetical protein